jgi:hypothetical protein
MEGECIVMTLFNLQCYIIVNDALDSVNRMVVCYNVLDCKLHRTLFTVKEHETLFVDWFDITSWQYYKYVNICNMHGLESCSISVYDMMRECGYKYTPLAVQTIGVLQYFEIWGGGGHCLGSVYM